MEEIIKTNTLKIAGILSVIFLFSTQVFARPEIEVETYFAQSHNELKVYRNNGRQDGSTILILGGIQGDEPGGYLSADLYADLPLEKGNLIVVPRANFESIILNQRGIDADMNRLFNRPGKVENVADSIVLIISDLMGEADIFLNLHDGFGFYSPVYINKRRNPKRFGQSLIADCDVYNHEGHVIDLKAIAETVLRKVNQKISNTDHHMNYMNTNSFDPKSNFREMINSGTYHALVNHGIPAFGIESSKDLPKIEDKILYHNLVINEFMSLYNIVPEIPGIKKYKPRMLFCHISINGEKPEIIYPGDKLKLKRGDMIEVKHISAGVENGLSCDILGLGSPQDLYKSVRLSNTTEIIFRKDSDIIAKVFIEIDSPPIIKEAILYKLLVNGLEFQKRHADTLSLQKNDILKIIDVQSNDFLSTEIIVNMKGWVPGGAYNTGEDRNYKIPASDLIWKKYSLNRLGKIYPIIVTLNNKEISRLLIELE